MVLAALAVLAHLLVLANAFTTDKVHAFYYLWCVHFAYHACSRLRTHCGFRANRYGNPEHDQGAFKHWNHRVLPHWSESVRLQYPGEEVQFKPEVRVLRCQVAAHRACRLACCTARTTRSWVPTRFATRPCSMRT